MAVESNVFWECEWCNANNTVSANADHVYLCYYCRRPILITPFVEDPLAPDRREEDSLSDL